VGLPKGSTGARRSMPPTHATTAADTPAIAMSSQSACMSLSRCNCSRAVGAATSLITVHLHGLVLALRTRASSELPVSALLRGFLARRAHGVPQAAVVRSERATLNLHASLPESGVRWSWGRISNLLEHVASCVAHHDFLRLLVPRCRHVVKAQPVLAF